jgi:hypothetical protein
MHVELLSVDVWIFTCFNIGLEQQCNAMESSSKTIIAPNMMKPTAPMSLRCVVRTHCSNDTNRITTFQKSGEANHHVNELMVLRRLIIDPDLAGIAWPHVCLKGYLVHVCVCVCVCVGLHFGRRQARTEHAANYSAEVLAVDEALEVLERRDAEEVHSEQERIVRAADEKVILLKDYAVKRRAVDLLAQAKPKGKAAKAKAKAAGKRKLPCSISHEDAKQWIPPDSSIWGGLTRGEWHGHCPPYRRTSAPWLRYGQEGALQVVIRALWTQHLDKHGLALADCPIEGVF